MKMLHSEREGIKPYGEFLEEGRARKIARRLFNALGVERPACECLSTKRVEMHHPDYSRPWLVGFLCARCHSNEHHGNLQRPYRLYDLRESF